MRFAFAVVASILLISAADVRAQDVAAFKADNADTRYFDFWEGNWRRSVDGKIDEKGTEFRVRRGVHRSSFVEEWDMTVDGNRIRANALRAWDKTNNRWMYTWASENALFQVWEGRKVGDDWYIYREFGSGDQRYLLRQAWIPKDRDHLTRVSEKSVDGGQTWTLRFREEYVRIGSK